MLQRNYLFIAGLMLCLALGCSFSTEPRLWPTGKPEDLTLAAVVKTVEAEATQKVNAPTPNAEATLVSVRQTVVAAATQTMQAIAPAPTPAPLPQPATAAPPTAYPGEEAMLILVPGPASAVCSPINVLGSADPVFEQTLVIQITDATGAVLAAQTTQIQAALGQRGPFAAAVPFATDTEQPGRVSVYAVSARDGGLTHLASAEVTLLPAGGQITLQKNQLQKEAIAILSPSPQSVIRGGTIHIAGFSEAVFENQLAVVLCGAGGTGPADMLCGATDNVLGRGTARVASPDAGQGGPFEADVTYSVTTTTPARIVIYDGSPRDDGFTHVSTQEVILEP